MTVCPIAIASGCKQCFAFSYCPLKSILGDYKPEEMRADEPTDNGHGERTKDE